MAKRVNRGRLSKDTHYSGLKKETIGWPKEGDNTLAKWKTEQHSGQQKNRPHGDKKTDSQCSSQRDRQYSGQKNKDKQWT